MHKLYFHGKLFYRDVFLYIFQMKLQVCDFVVDFYRIKVVKTSTTNTTMTVLQIFVIECEISCNESY